MRAWLFQDHRQKKKLGEKKCPWSVGWIDPEGKRRSKKIGSKSMAEKYRRKVEGELAAGLYQVQSNTTWADFREQYAKNVAVKNSAGNQLSEEIALNHFERLIKPKTLRSIKSPTIDEFIARRSNERGRKKGSKVSPATINRELRHLKTVLRKAHEYGHLPEVPKIRMLKEPVKQPTFVKSEHFSEIYQACDVATRPSDQPFPASDWWRAMLVFNFMTGWRIGEPLSLKRVDLDLEAGTAMTRYGDNKGCRDDVVHLHPVVIDHLKRIVCFNDFVFPWDHDRRQLYAEFLKIQQHAGIKLPCREDHEHTPHCFVYGFHDLRRAFATENAHDLGATQLQRLMRHKDFSTTVRYINMAHGIKDAVQKLHVPDVLKTKRG